MINFFKKPEVLLVLFALSSLIFGWNIADIISDGFASGKKMLTQVMNISGWLFMTIFFFYYFIKSKSNKSL